MLTVFEILAGIVLVVFSISQIRWYILPSNPTKWHDMDNPGPPFVSQRETNRNEFEKGRVIFFALLALAGGYLIILGVMNIFEKA